MNEEQTEVPAEAVVEQEDTSITTEEVTQEVLGDATGEETAAKTIVEMMGVDPKRPMPTEEEILAMIDLECPEIRKGVEEDVELAELCKHICDSIPDYHQYSVFMYNRETGTHAVFLFGVGIYGALVHGVMNGHKESVKQALEHLSILELPPIEVEDGVGPKWLTDEDLAAFEIPDHMDYMITTYNSDANMVSVASRFTNRTSFEIGSMSMNATAMEDALRTSNEQNMAMRQQLMAASMGGMPGMEGMAGMFGENPDADIAE